MLARPDKWPVVSEVDMNILNLIRAPFTEGASDYARRRSLCTCRAAFLHSDIKPSMTAERSCRRLRAVWSVDPADGSLVCAWTQDDGEVDRRQVLTRSGLPGMACDDLLLAA
ncbi:hypothetical protein CTI14_00065 [Methylobacterium radiotolerans]|nr:hypothetical protein CTI14_00065 [Methylobacterium radiotolerans]